MTPLGPLPDEIVALLAAESSRPLSVGSIREVLRCARGLILEDGELEAALDRLLQDGRIEIVHSMKVGPRYRLQRHDRGDMSRPGGEAA
jgi:hypothetical protein